MAAKKAPKLTPTEAKVVKAKIKAELANRSQNEAAKEVFPNQTPEAAAVSMTRTLKKANVQEALHLALEKHNLTPDRIVGVVNDGMKAERTVILGNGEDAFADVVPDHSIRLKAAGMAANFMGIGKDSGGTTVNLNFGAVTEEMKGKYED